MAGQLTIDTLKASSGVLATQNGMTGICKAWAKFQGGNGNTAGVITASFNVSSITVNGTGDYTANFTTAMPDANYSCVGNTINGTSGQLGRSMAIPYNNSTTTTSVRMATFVTWTASGTIENQLTNSFAIFGS